MYDLITPIRFAATVAAAVLGQRQPRPDTPKLEKIGLLEVISSRGTDATVDVLFVECGGPAAVGAWVSYPSLHCWPKDFLYQDIPEARILMFDGYNHFRSPLINFLYQATSWPLFSAMAFLQHRAQSVKPVMSSTTLLASEVSALRSRTESSMKPIILIGYGVGGMICKDLFSNTVLQSYTVGIILMDCPLTNSTSYFTHPSRGFYPGSELELSKVDSSFKNAAFQNRPSSMTQQIVSILRSEELLSPELKDFGPDLFPRSVEDNPRAGSNINPIIGLARFDSQQEEGYWRILTILDSWLMESQTAACPILKKLPGLAWTVYSRLNDPKSPNVESAPQFATLSTVLKLSLTRYYHRFMPQHIIRLVHRTCERIHEFLYKATREGPSKTVMDPLLKEVRDMNAQMLCGREFLRRHETRNESPRDLLADIGSTLQQSHTTTRAPLALRPLEPSNTIYPFSEDLKSAVKEILDHYQIGWSFIDVCYFSFVDCYKPTVIVTAVKSTDSSLRAELLQKIYDIVPRFLHGEFGGLEIFDGQSTPHAPFIGGPVEINSMRATLGGYISLQRVDASGSLGEFETGNFILTNHHLVRPAPQPCPPPPVGPWRLAISVNDAEHTKPVATMLRPCGCSAAVNRPICPYEAEYERLRRKRNGLLTCGASTAEIDELIPQYGRFGQQCNSFAEVIGKVWATSGLRVSAAGHRLDWAIIKVNGDTECENLAPPSSSAIPYRAPLSTLPQTVDNAKRIKLARVEAGVQTVAKLGYRGASYGIMNANKWTKVKVTDWDQETTELCAYGYDLNLWPHGHGISMQGDSGSWILNSEGNLIGLLWGGNERVNVAFVTPIEDIVADIQNQTGRVVRLSGGVDIMSRDPACLAYY